MSIDQLSDLIHLEENETILCVISEQKEKLARKYLDTDWHTLTDLPRSFFHIDKRSITYTYTNVFTNKRYIALGLEFEQIYDKKILNLMEKSTKIRIDNYQLSIEKDLLSSYQIHFGIDYTGISFGNLLGFNCRNNNRLYFQIKQFLIYQWGFSVSEFEEKEQKAFNKANRFHLISNLLEYAVLLYPLIGLYSVYFAEPQTRIFELQLAMILSFFLLMTIIKSIFLGIIQHKKYLLLSGNINLFFIVCVVIDFIISAVCLYLYFSLY